MVERVIERLPSVEDVERELCKNRREADLLRSIRNALARKRVQEQASELLRRRNESGVAYAG